MPVCSPVLEGKRVAAGAKELYHAAAELSGEV